MNISKAIGGVKRAMSFFEESRMEVYAAQASFFIVLSSVPFLMVTLMLVNLFMPGSREELVTMVNSVLPSSMQSFGLYILEEIASKSTGPVISVTVLTSLWSSSRGIKAVSCGIQYVYGTAGELHGFLRTLKSLLYTVVFVGILIFSLAFVVFGRELQRFLAEKLPPAAAVTGLILNMRGIIAFAVLTLFFSVVYKALGGRRLKLRAQLPGAVLSATGWLVISFLYPVHISYFSNYSYVYGSLAAVMLLMLWLYVCMIIVLLGASLNSYLQKCPVQVI